MNNENSNNLKNQNIVGENSNNFINEQHAQNGGSNEKKAKNKKTKKLSEKELALKNLEQLRTQKENENTENGTNENQQPEQQEEIKTNKQQSKLEKQSAQLPMFKTKKELNKQLNKEVRKNKDLRKEDVLDRQERQLRSYLRKIEEEEQKRKGQLEKQATKEPKTPTASAMFGGASAGIGDKIEQPEKTSTSSIKSLDDLILATQISKKPTEKTKTHADYVNELKSSEQTDEEISQEKGENFLQEKQSILERLQRIDEVREELPVEEEEKRKRRGIFWWFILLGLLGLVIVMGYLVMDAFRPIIPDYISISVSMVNPEDVFTEEITTKPIEIQPGDEFPLRIELTNNSSQGNNVYVRFKVVVEITRDDGHLDDYPEYINVVFSNEEKWERFDEEEEKRFEYGVSSDDYFNYYIGELETDETIELIKGIEFDLWKIDGTDEQGQQLAGQQVRIKVLVEAIEYFNADMQNPGHWETAPRAWINKIDDFKNQQEKEKAKS